MSSRYLAASVAVTAIVVVTVWLTDLSFQRAILLAPVLVIGVGAAAGLVVFWGRVGWESLRKTHAMDLDLILPGHGEPVRDHRSLIDQRFEMHERRKAKLYALIEESTRTAH